MKKTRKIALFGTSFLLLGGLISGASFDFSNKVDHVFANSAKVSRNQPYVYYTGTYYDSIPETTINAGGTTLLSALNKLIKPSSAFGYANIWTFNEEHDQYPSDYDGKDPLTGNSYPTTENTLKRGKMWDVYSDTNWSGSQRGGNVSSNVGVTYNREHSMPKSWFGGSTSNQPGTDPHHLYNTDGKVNGVRSNYPYGEVVHVETNCYTMTHGAVGFGKLGTNSNGDKVFEPDDAYKGDLARSQMYMATAYYDWNLNQESRNSGKCFSYSGGVSTMKSYYINLLTKWSAEDPVSQKELNRNNAIFDSSQKNRNPFIDHPTWANKIWGGTEYTWGSSSSDVDLISISASNVSVKVNETATISVALNPTNASPSPTLTYQSSNTNVATVSNKGVVTGIAAGNATITVKAKQNSIEKTATCNVTVSSSSVAVTGVSLSSSSLTLSSGESSRLTPTIVPSNATNKNVTWSSSNPDVATVSGGVVSAVASGTTNITVTTQDGGFTARCVVTVSEEPVKQVLESISVSNLHRNFAVNSEFIKETVTAHYTGGKADAVVTNSAVFSSVDMSTEGSKTVNVSYTEDGVTKSTSYQINVIKETVPVTGVQIEVEGQITLDNGQSQTLVATVLPKDATNKNIAWSSNNPSCVLVDNNGKITAKSPGNAIITVTTEDGNFTDTVSVAVNDTEVIPVEKINVTPTELTLDEGAESQLTIEVLPENATNKDVNVTISNSSVVSCDDKFNVKGLKGGSAIITITSVTNEDVNATVNVTVNEKAQPKLAGIEVTNKPNKLVYEVGETFNSEGLVIDAYYLDGTRKSVIPSIVSSVDTSTAGKKTVTVFYLEDSATVSTTFEIMVADNKPVSLLKTSDPIKTTYYSTESVNLFGLKVSAVYADGSKEDISNVLSYETFTVSDVEKDVFLRYMDFDPIIIKLTIKSGSPKTEDKAFDYALSFDEKNVVKDTVSLGTWELLEAKFNGLDYSTQSYLKKYDVSQSSKEVSAGNDDEVAKVINIYDDVVMNRKAEGFKDFMGRNPQPKSDTKGYDFIPTILKIVLWSMVGVAALVTLLRLILRKN